jgi:hypothetical protein
MDNDPGRGSRSHEPPKLANVRRLHLDEAAGSATATEDWYETERLTGHITGRAGDTSTVDRAAPSQNEAPAVLDWRHTEATPPPTALERLRRTLERRGRPQLTFRAPRRDSRARRGGPAAATTTNENAAAEALPAPDEPAVEDHRAEAPRPPLLGLRHDPEQRETRTARSLRAKLRKHSPHFRWGRGASIGTFALAAAATATIGIASAISGSPAKPRQASLGATTSAQALGVGTAAKSLTAALGLVEHQAPTRSAARHSATARRPRHKTRHRTHAASKRSRVAASGSPPPAVPPPAATSSSSPSYSGSSSAPSTSSQSGTSEPASTASTQRSQPTHQPAFGQNGSLGPGRGAPGTQ